MTMRIVSSHKEITLFDDLSNPEHVEELVKELNSAGPEDKITILLACPGGLCSLGQWVINAVKESKAYVTTRVIYPSHSMASLIALAGNNLVMDDGSYLMFHNYSSGAMGKGDALVSGINADDKALKQLNEVCAPFLDKAEMKGINNDKDVYIFWDNKDLQARIKRHFKQR